MSIKRQTTRGRLISAVAIIVVVAIVLFLAVSVIIGLAQVVRFIFGLISDLIRHVAVRPNWDWLLDLYSTQDSAGRHPVAEKIAAIGAFFTAIFTLALCYVTREIGRASQRQAAGDAPLLRVDVTVDAAAVRGFESAQKDADEGREATSFGMKARPRKKSVYPEGLTRLDEAIFAANALPAVSPRFVRVRVENVQSKPFAVARDIVITVALDASRWQPVAQDRASIEESMARSPRDVFNPGPERRMELELLPPGRFKRKPLFNVGPFIAEGDSRLKVSVVDVEYRDLRGKRRRLAAYGQLTVTIFADGTIKGTDGYSRPERWEMP